MTWLEERNAKFPAEVVALAQKMDEKYGFPACVTLAQWFDESADGKRPIGKYNDFGLKWPETKAYRDYLVKVGCKPIAEPTHEEEHGQMVAEKALFIDFPSLEAAFDYHAYHLVRHVEYAACRPFLNDWVKYIAHFSPIYASNEKYGHDLMAIILKYHLADFNTGKK